MTLECIINKSDDYLEAPKETCMKLSISTCLTQMGLVKNVLTFLVKLFFYFSVEYYNLEGG